MKRRLVSVSSKLNCVLGPNGFGRFWASWARGPENAGGSTPTTID
ncbi:MAG TPA: hypothetical protein VEY91_13460 [Candidatus Limnocylindria bacterium]|nr:hypothetical protein [Candidatus Limnocylindria bacterium]